MMNNPLYKDIIINKTDLNDEIDLMSEQLLNELVTYDEYRLAKEQLEENRENEDNKTEEVVMKGEDMSDSEDEDEKSVADALTEELGNGSKDFM